MVDGEKQATSLRTEEIPEELESLEHTLRKIEEAKTCKEMRDGGESDADRTLRLCRCGWFLLLGAPPWPSRAAHNYDGMGS
jgi:hypothetical protein